MKNRLDSSRLISEVNLALCNYEIDKLIELNEKAFDRIFHLMIEDSIQPKEFTDYQGFIRKITI